MAMPAIIPRSLLFGIPSRQTPSLSPDGRRVAFVAPFEDARTIWVTGIDRDDPMPLPGAKHTGLSPFYWAYDGRHLMFVKDRDGDETTHLYAADIVTGEVGDLTPFDGVQARVLALWPAEPHHILVGLNMRDRWRHDAYRLDLRTGGLTMVARNPGFSGWIADRRLRVRGGFRWERDGGLSIMVRDHEEAEWRPVHVVDPEDSACTRPIGFTGDGRALVLLSSADANTARVLRVDVDTGDTKVLYQDPEYDVTTVDQHPQTGEPDLVVVERERPVVEPLTPAAAHCVTELRRALSGAVRPLGRDAAGRTWLVLEYAPEQGGVYHTYEPDAGRIRTLFRHRPELVGYTLAQVEPFSFRARDGRAVHGYLTFPPGLERHGLPTVLAVHGGPWDRDQWGSGECQWLANRGYLCVQVNFRGSTGYGKDFVNAGDREWGGRMQDDLTDAVRWVVTKGYADPARVAIYGGSYGGYAALAGAAFTPDLYRCVVAASAPTDLRTFTRSSIDSSPLLAARIRSRIGNPESEADFLLSRSPLSRVDDIRVPVLLAHGANDPRVRRAEADQLAAALEAKGIPHEFLMFPDEGHTFTKTRNRLAFYACAERFLAEHLGGRYGDDR